MSLKQHGLSFRSELRLLRIQKQTANPVSLEMYIPALRSGFLSVFGFSTVVDELASSVVCGDICINHTLQGGTLM